MSIHYPKLGAHPVGVGHAGSRLNPCPSKCGSKANTSLIPLRRITANDAQSTRLSHSRPAASSAVTATSC